MSGCSCFIVGSFRSGTSWLGEILSAGMTAQYDFEPFEPAWNKSVRRLRLRNRYLDPAQLYSEEDHCIASILSGRPWKIEVKTGSRNPIFLFRWKWWRRRRVIKDVQVHLLVPYLRKDSLFRSCISSAIHAQ